MAPRNKEGLERQLALFRHTFAVSQRLVQLFNEALAEHQITTRHWLLIRLLQDEFADEPTITELAHR